MNSNPFILRAVEVAGSQKKLSMYCGISQQHISGMLNGKRSISANVAIAIEKGTAGIVNRSHLRPDLWPPDREAAR